MALDLTESTIITIHILHVCSSIHQKLRYTTDDTMMIVIRLMLYQYVNQCEASNIVQNWEHFLMKVWKFRKQYDNGWVRKNFVEHALL